MTELCKSCARQNFCGNNTTTDYCTGYAPYVETRWEADDIKTPPFTQWLKKIIQATERLNENGKYRGVDDDLRGDNMKSLVIMFVGLSVIVLAEGMILAELFGFNRVVTGLLFAVGGGFCFWYWIRQINWVKNE